MRSVGGSIFPEEILLPWLVIIHEANFDYIYRHRPIAVADVLSLKLL